MMFFIKKYYLECFPISRASVTLQCNKEGKENREEKIRIMKLIE